MQQTEQTLSLATFYKVMSGEPLTIQEVNRWATIITTPFNVSSPTGPEVEQLKFQIRQALKQVYEIK
jgi:hypothetical protein